MWSIAFYIVGALSGFFTIYYVFINVVLASEESCLLDPKDD
ncbi:hypothetical protein [Shewanella jiangmenensis]|nr:hypothetical protein [Shewanella jiangmenensis]